jgi:hypothetical protein
MEDYHLPICVACYAVRVEPARRYLERPTCAGCGETEARAVRYTIAPLDKSNYVLITDPTILKQLNPKRTT